MRVKLANWGMGLALAYVVYFVLGGTLDNLPTVLGVTVILAFKLLWPVALGVLFLFWIGRLGRLLAEAIERR